MFTFHLFFMPGQTENLSVMGNLFYLSLLVFLPTIPINHCVCPGRTAQPSLPRVQWKTTASYSTITNSHQAVTLEHSNKNVG